MFLGDGGEHRVFKDAEFAFGERPPRFGDDAFGAERVHLCCLLVEGVDFNLVGGRHDFVEDAKVDDAVGGEIAHADGADFARCLVFLQRAPGAVDVVEGLVQQHQVDVAAVEARKRTIKRGFGGFIAVVFHPDFAGDEDFFTRHAALFDALPDFGLVHVGLSGVDVAVACFDRLRHCLRGFCGRNLVDAEAEDGDLYAVVQGKGLHGDVPYKWSVNDLPFAARRRCSGGRQF